MSIAQGNSPYNHRPAAADQQPPHPELTQLVLPGFEHLEAPYTLQPAPEQAKTRRQRRPRPVGIKLRPDQLRMPYPAR